MNNIVLAALLHDIGKLYQRAYWGRAPEGLEDWSHPAYTAWAIRQHGSLFKGAGLEPDWLVQTSSRHHEGWRDKPQYQPQTPEQWCVALADTYASKERDKGDEIQGQPYEVPLEPIFMHLRVQEKTGTQGMGYSQVRTGEEAGLAAGVAYPEAKPNVRKDTYWRLAERLDERLQALARAQPDQNALLANLLGIFQELLWHVPADTQGDPGVSLYDHLRLTGAIAAALWGYHGGNPTVETLKDEPTGQTEKFLLVLGDLGGIQSHIYRIQGSQTGVGGMAKRLRARSLEVSLAAEAMGLELLRRTGFTPLQRIMSAGGKFFMLLPNTEAVKQAIEATQREWDEWARRQGATLLPFLAAHPFTPRGFENFSQVLQDAHARLNQAKLNPLASLLSHPYLAGEQSLRPCAACGVRPAQQDTPGSLCKECERDKELGRLLPQKDQLIFTQKADPPFYRFPESAVAVNGLGQYTLRTRLDFTPEGHPWEVRLLAGHVPRVLEAVKAEKTLSSQVLNTTEAYEAWAIGQGLADRDDNRGQERPLTFAELAEFSTGAKYLGALMLDADRMGEAFASGFENPSPSRIAALSRMLELFFAGEVLELIRNPQTYTKRLGWQAEAAWKQRHYPLIYAVYAGGDDLFLLGPWDILLEFALDLNALYRQFTCHERLTLSGGLVLVNPSLPIPLLAETVQEAEQAAKAAGRDRLHLLGQSVSWEDLRKLVPWVNGLRQHLKAGGEQGMSSALAYRLLGLWKQHQKGGEAQRMRYKPLLAYALRDKNDVREHYLQLTNHHDPAWRHLPVWVQWGLYLER